MPEAGAGRPRSWERGSTIVSEPLKSNRSIATRRGRITEPPSSILVYVGLDYVGDAMMKLPFVRALRQAFPRARITWLAGKGRTAFAGTMAPLVRGLIDEVIEDIPVGINLTELIGRPLPDRFFDLIIDTQRRFLTTLILRRINHRYFISGCAGFVLSDIRPRGRYAKPAAMIRQMLDLVELASGQRAQTNAPLMVEEQVLTVARTLLPGRARGPEASRYVGLAPGAGDRRKCWPLDSYLALGRALIADGLIPVVFLGPGELEWADVVRASLPEALMPEQTAGIAPSPMLTIALGQRLAVAVANDAGVGHLLAASGVKMVSLFGPTSPKKFAPTASELTVLCAQEFDGTEALSAIPVEVVRTAVLDHICCPNFL
jgi:ADP-heptose:LPS heptosyltransferase